MKFIVRRLIKDSRTFSEAVALGIKGVHLAHITRRALEAHELTTYFDEVLQQLDDYFNSMHASCLHGGLMIREAYKHKTQTLHAVRRRMRKLNSDSRNLAKAQYDAFVREVERRFTLVRTTALKPE